MVTTQQIAKHLREVYVGGNWTTSSLKEHLAELTWQQATKSIYSLNSIATLVNHLHYYVKRVSKVLEGEELVAKDALSFTHPPINTQEDWDRIVKAVWEEAEKFAALIEKLPDTILKEDFTDPKYGIYYRNLHGIIEHIHYHLGQIVVIKKIILQKETI